MSASPELVDAARRYLASKRCVLWQSFTLDSPEGLDKAAEWLAGEVVEVLIEKAHPSGWSDLGVVGPKEPIDAR